MLPFGLIRFHFDHCTHSEELFLNLNFTSPNRLVALPVMHQPFLHPNLLNPHQSHRHRQLPDSFIWCWRPRLTVGFITAHFWRRNYCSSKGAFTTDMGAAPSPLRPSQDVPSVRAHATNLWRPGKKTTRFLNHCDHRPTKSRTRLRQHINVYIYVCDICIVVIYDTMNIYHLPYWTLLRWWSCVHQRNPAYIHSTVS